VEDPEFEQLKRKRLAVLNVQPEPVGELVLEDPGMEPSTDKAPESVRDGVVAALRNVYDPEIPLNIYDLGLIYDCILSDDGSVHVKMTLTAPGCPVAGTLVRDVHDRVRHVPGVRVARTELVWDPPWTRERMSEAARLELGLM
jgi:FeS assembly SUF system protein